MRQPMHRNFFLKFWGIKVISLLSLPSPSVSPFNPRSPTLDTKLQGIRAVRLLMVQMKEPFLSDEYIACRKAYEEGGPKGVHYKRMRNHDHLPHCIWPLYPYFVNVYIEWLCI